VGLEWGLLSLVSTIEELLERQSSGSSLESREYGRRDVTLTTRLLSANDSTLNSPRSGGRSVGIFQATGISLTMFSKV
jgi:hypothetical protein